MRNVERIAEFYRATAIRPWMPIIVGPTKLSQDFLRTRIH